MRKFKKLVQIINRGNEWPEGFLTNLVLSLNDEAYIGYSIHNLRNDNRFIFFLQKGLDL
jgi:hypothetical protein